MNSLEGKLIFANSGYGDRRGWFKVVEHDGGQYLRGKRVMRPDGTIVKNSKLRIKFDVIGVDVVTPESLQKRREAAYDAADAELEYLLAELHK
jgi:hypothetical protein